MSSLVVIPDPLTVSGSLVGTPPAIFAQMDTPLLDASVTTINSNTGAFVQVVSSLSKACTAIRIADTTGQFIGLYTGASGFETLAMIINPGADGDYGVAIPYGTRISLRAMGTSNITTGNLVLQFGA